MAEENIRPSLVSELNYLGEYAKALENNKSPILDNAKFIIFRLDGHGFSKFTRGFDKPFDLHIIRAMQKTSEDLVSKYNASIAYTQSDEITLLIPPIYNDLLHEYMPLQFNGRRQKLESLSASYTSVRFNYHLIYMSSELANKETYKYSKMNNGTAHFDCRALECTTDDIRNVFRWRQLDGLRNGTSTLARTFYSTDQLYKKNISQQIEMLNSCKQFGAKSIPDHMIHGTWIKKQNIKKVMVDKLTEKEVEVVRTIMVHVNKYVNSIWSVSAPTPSTEELIIKYHL